MDDTAETSAEVLGMVVIEAYPGAPSFGPNPVRECFQDLAA